MESTRFRVGSILEWGIAAACSIAALVLGSAAGQEARALRPVTPVIAGARATIDPPASIPSSAAFVPMLVLRNGSRLEVGDTAADASDKVSGWQVGSDTIERGPNGDRVTRSYRDGSQSFLLVIESAEEGADAKVAAIYLENQTHAR